jgi:hypothetical protein
VHAHTIEVGATFASRRLRGVVCRIVSPTWIWMQVAIVVFVLIGMIVAVTKLV